MSNSRSPRAVRSMTMGMRGMAEPSHIHRASTARHGAVERASARQPLERALVLGHQRPQARLELSVVAAALDALVDRGSDRLGDGHVVDARHRLEVRRKLVAEPQGHRLRHPTASIPTLEHSFQCITNLWWLGSVADRWRG